MRKSTSSCWGLRRVLRSVKPMLTAPPIVARAGVIATSMTSTSGLSLPMSLRLLATERRTYREGSSFSSSSMASTGRGSRWKRRSLAAQGRRGRVASETRRRTCSLASPAHSARRASVACSCRSRKGRMLNSAVKRCVSSYCARMDVSKWSRPWLATNRVCGRYRKDAMPPSPSCERGLGPSEASRMSAAASKSSGRCSASAAAICLPRAAVSRVCDAVCSDAFCTIPSITGPDGPRRFP